AFSIMLKLLASLTTLALLALLASCDNASSNAPTPTVEPQPATSADLELINQSITNTQNLKSYHEIYEVICDGQTTTKVDKDVAEQFRVYMTGTIQGQEIELLRNGGKFYEKDASGKWLSTR